MKEQKMSSHEASSHSKLVLFSSFNGGFEEKYQQRKENIRYQVKGKNTGQGVGSGF